MYIILEIQSTGGVTSCLPALVYADWNEAESVYHSKLSFAATSTVHLHVVAMYDEYGNLIKQEWYEHLPETE